MVSAFASKLKLTLRTHQNFMVHTSLLHKIRTVFHQFRYSISYVDALPQLTFLGLLVGLATGLIIILFRLAIDFPLEFLLPGGADNFESLSPQMRTLAIFAGCAVLYILLKSAGKERSQVSVGHVLDRLHNFQGRMPSANWYVQFIGGMISIVSGQSVGREGPAVHLGAGAASRISRWLRLPNNSRYTLIACGVSAAIAASFDTPLAGVIFAMEVILMEYSIVGFVPIILSSVTGAALSQAVFNDPTPLLSQSPDAMRSLLELPFMVFSGVFIACAAGSFIAIHLRTLKLNQWSLAIRLLLAAIFTAAVAWFVPEVMGLGYDTLNSALAGEIDARILLLVAVAKLAVTAVVLGLGVPGGVIGPTLVIGACLGGCLGNLANWLYSTPTAEPGFYVIIGMTGMMAAVLNAPMAALVAVLELSYNPNMIFPSMLVIVIACIITRTVFSFEGLFIEQLQQTGRPIQFQPAQEALKKTGIANVMAAQLVYARRFIDYEEAKALLLPKPQWIVLDFKENETRDKIALNPADLSKYLQEAPVDVLSLEKDIDLLAIPARRLVLSPIHETATLWEALLAIRNGGAEALYVSRINNPIATSVQGILTEESIKNFYQV